MMTTYPPNTHPIYPEDATDYLLIYWTLGSVIDEADANYPVSGDDLARWRKALAS